MIKQKIAPLYFQHDIVNSEMPSVFLDETAKIKIYLYETNQEFDQIFLDENDQSVRLVECKLHKELDCWLAQNFTKQINPFQNASAAKTIAMQTELEMYILENLQNLITKKFYFFTFAKITADNIIEVDKYLIKENIDNVDRLSFRFAKIKAWLLSSVLIKNFQYWKFIYSVAELGRKKIRQVRVKLPSTAGFGEIKINGNNILGQAPQDVDYTLANVVHPFEKLEPVAVNFNYKNGQLYQQLLHWDYFGESIITIRNNTPSIGALNQWGTLDFSRYSYGIVSYMPGAIFGPAPTGEQYGLAQAYCEGLKDKSNDLKQYMWSKEYYFNRNQREYWNLKKTNSTSSVEFIQEFIKNSSVTWNFSPWWNPEWDTPTLGSLFYSFTMQVFNSDNFQTNSELLKVTEINSSQYCWIMMGQINFYDIGIFSKKTNNQNSFTNSSYYNFGTWPQGFLSPNKLKQMMNTIRKDKSKNEIILNLNLVEDTYLNSISINVVNADALILELVDDNNQVYNYETNTSFYLIGQDQITTKINFF